MGDTTEIDDIKRKGLAYFAYLDQGKTWVPKRPRPPLPVAEMDDAWRYNASRWLERRAGSLAWLYVVGLVFAVSEPVLREVIGEIDGVPVESGRRYSHIDLMGERAHDAFEEETERITREPLPWLRTTKLHRALVDGLPAGRKLANLGERARHWSTCPARAKLRAECQCRASCDRKPAPCLVCEHKYCDGCPECSPEVPEWTTS